MGFRITSVVASAQIVAHEQSSGSHVHGGSDRPAIRQTPQPSRKSSAATTTSRTGYSARLSTLQNTVYRTWPSSHRASSLSKYAMDNPTAMAQSTSTESHTRNAEFC